MYFEYDNKVNMLVPRCHTCVRRPKLITAVLPPTSPVDGLAWYFNFPSEGMSVWEDPMPVVQLEAPPRE